jgi:hypothetical protein
VISADVGGVGYCTALTPTLFFTSGLELGVLLMSDEDASLQSGGVGHQSESVHWYNILDGNPARLSLSAVESSVKYPPGSDKP